MEDARTKAFIAWARGAGIKCHPNISPASFGGLRGVGATGSIRSKDLLVTVPRDVAVVLAPKQRNPCPAYVTDAWWREAPWFSKIGIILLYERSLGSKSRLAPYLEQLPLNPGVPVLWDDTKLQQLQYPYLTYQVKEQQNEWSTLHAQLVASGMAPGAAPPSLADLYWAMACVRSRTFSGPYVGSTLQDRLRLAGVVTALGAANLILGAADAQQTASAALAVVIFNILYDVILGRSLKQYALCPLIDLFNHSSAAVESEVTFDYFSSSYTVAPSRDFSKGEQVFISYGQQSNDSLMQYYGFAEVGNPADVYVMTNLLKHLDQHAPQPLAQQRLDALNAAGLLNSLQLVTVQRNGVPAETLQALRYLLASSTEAAAGIGAFARGASAEVEAAVAQLLVASVRAELASLGTSLEEDLALARSTKTGGGGGSGVGSAGGRRGGAVDQSILGFRIEKKQVLHGVLAQLGAAGP